MTTLHQIGELLRFGVRPTDEETKHLEALGGFVAEMYGRFMGGHAEHLSSAADLWSGRLSDRLSAATGARWEQGLGLAEILLGSELTSFWQIANEGFRQGYHLFEAERSLLELYEDEVEAPPVEELDVPRRRRGSLFGAKQKQAPWQRRASLFEASQARRQGASASGREPLEMVGLGQEGEGAEREAGADRPKETREVGPREAMTPMQRAMWADGSLAELAVIRALAAGGLFVGDQVKGLEGRLGAAPAGAHPMGRSVGQSIGQTADVSGQAIGQALASRAAARPSGEVIGRAAARPSGLRSAVFLDGVRIDERTPALASALARVDTVFSRSQALVREGGAAITQERLGRLTASADYSIDRGLGSGERPVYGFYDAVDTTYLNLVDDDAGAGAPPVDEAPVALRRVQRPRFQQAMPASLQAMRRAAEPVAAAAAAGRESQAARTDRVANLSLGAVVEPVAGLRPFVGGVFNNTSLAAARFDSVSGRGLPGESGGEVAAAAMSSLAEPFATPDAIAFASRIAHLPSGEPTVRVQRGGMSAPRYAIIESVRSGERVIGTSDMPLTIGLGTDGSVIGIEGGAAAGALRDIGGGAELQAPRAAGQPAVARPSVGREPGAAVTSPSIAGFEPLTRALDGSGSFAGGAVPASVPLGGSIGIGGGFVLGAGRGGASGTWRLAADGGNDLPLGATFSRHEVFAGTRASQHAAHAHMTRQGFRPLIAGADGARPSELAHALDGMVWVTLPTNTEVAASDVDNLGLKAVPARRAAMVPAGLAMQSIANAAVGAQRAQRARSVAAAASASGAAEGLPSPEKLGFSSLAEMERVARAIEATWSTSRVDSLEVVALADKDRLTGRTTKAQAAPTAGATAGLSAAAQATPGLAQPAAQAMAGRASTMAGTMIDGARLTRMLRSGMLADIGARLRGPATLRGVMASAAAPGVVATAQQVADVQVGQAAVAPSGPAAEAFRRAGGDFLAARWVGQALEADGIERGLKAARFLDGAVEAGYGRIDSERQLLSVTRDAQPTELVDETPLTAVGLGRRTEMRAPLARSGLARMVAGVGARTGEGAGARAGEGVEGSSSTERPSIGVDARISSARLALARGVVTARESRAVAALAEALAEPTHGGARAFATAAGSFETVGFDEPVLGRLVQRMNEGRAEAPLAARWDSPEALFERVAKLDATQRQRVMRELGAAGWTREELELLSLTPRTTAAEAGVDVAAGRADEASRPSRGEEALRLSRGEEPATVSGAADQARLSRMSRSLARVVSGGEALGGPVDQKQAGARAGAFAQAQAASWLPLLGSKAQAKYFGELAPAGGARRTDVASLRDAVGELVKMAEATVAASDAPVELAARRELWRRARAVEEGVPGAERLAPTARGGVAEGDAAGGPDARGGVAPRDAFGEPDASASLADRIAARGDAIGAEALAAKAPGLTSLDTDLGTRFAQREMRIGDVEQAKLRLEREREDRGLEGTAERSSTGLEGSRSTARRTGLEGGGATTLEGRLAKALSLSTAGPAGVRRMLRTGPGAVAPAREEARDGAVQRRLRRGEVDEATLIRDTVASGAEPGRQQVRIGSQLRHDAMVDEEARHALSVMLGGVMAPEAMLTGLRSPELSQALRHVAARRMQVGDDLMRVLTTLADSGIDLSASRSSLAPVITGRAQVDVARGIGSRGEAVMALGTELAQVGERASAIGMAEPRQGTSVLASEAPEQSLVELVMEAEGIMSRPPVAQILKMGRAQKAGLLSAILRGTERAEMTAILEQAGGREFATAWLNRVDGSRSGIDIGMQQQRFEFGRAFGVKPSVMASESPMADASWVDTSLPDMAGVGGGDARRERASLVSGKRGDDKSGLRSLAAQVTHTSTGAARPQHGASQAMRRTDWSFIETGSKASTSHADLGKLASAIVGSSESAQRAPMPLVAPAVKAVAQTALRDPTTKSAAAPSGGGGGKGGDDKRGPVDAKMSEKAMEMLAVEMANRVARLMGLTNERRGIWS